MSSHSINQSNMHSFTIIKHSWDNLFRRYIDTKERQNVIAECSSLGARIREAHVTSFSIFISHFNSFGFSPPPLYLYISLSLHRLVVSVCVFPLFILYISYSLICLLLLLSLLLCLLHWNLLLILKSFFH